MPKKKHVTPQLIFLNSQAILCISTLLNQTSDFLILMIMSNQQLILYHLAQNKYFCMVQTKSALMICKYNLRADDPYFVYV